MSEDGDELSNQVKDLSIENGVEDIAESFDDQDNVEEITTDEQVQDQSDLDQPNTETNVKEIDDDDDNDDDDDDFGAFSDASFDEFEQPPNPTPDTDTTISQPKSSQYTQLPQDTFSHPDELKETLSKLLDQAYPSELPKLSIPENTSILNERSQLLLERLTALPYLKPYNWKKSSLRRQLLVTLGIPDSEPTNVLRKKNLDDGMQYKIISFQELGFTEDDAIKYKNQSDEILQKGEEVVKNGDDHAVEVLDDEGIDQLIGKYKEEITQVENLLAVWEHEREKLELDNETFEGVVENLVGHTQRLRREETLRSLKKEANKSKGLGSFLKKKSKK